MAKARGIDEQKLIDELDRFIEKRQFGFLGEERMNVLILNQAIEKKYEKSPSAL